MIEFSLKKVAPQPAIPNLSSTQIRACGLGLVVQKHPYYYLRPNTENNARNLKYTVVAINLKKLYWRRKQVKNSLTKLAI